LPESHDELRRCLHRDDLLAFYVLCQNLQGSGSPKSFTETWLMRLFRRRPGLRFIGRCHPDFRQALMETATAEGKRVCQSTIRFRHYGYLGDLKESKLRRAARLLKLELEDRPGQLYYQIEYGRTLLLLGEAGGHAILREAARAVRACQQELAAPLPLVAA